MKVAVCLVVKNEQTEIIYWAAWYKALGFDTLIIYDDFSDDATEEVILSMQGGIDIRYMRNAVNRDIHNVRQVRAYNDAVIRYGHEFDWIAFFDADEYLDLYGKNIKSYLSEQGNASLVAFNWCCVGTNGYVSRPEGVPFLNYTRTGSNELFWNRHTKVIFRPDRLSRPVYQVHNVDVHGTSVDSEGLPVEWESPSGGFTRNSPTWKGARLIHYQSRSLEHYINRDRHLEDVRRDVNDPLHTVVNNPEYNAIESTISADYMRDFYKWMDHIVSQQTHTIARVLRSTSSCFITQLESILAPPNVPVFQPAYKAEAHEIAHNWISFHTTPGKILSEHFDGRSSFVAFHIENHFGHRLTSVDGKLSTDSENGIPLIGIYCEGSEYVHIFTSSGEELRVNGDSRVTKVLTYKVWNNEDGSISISHPRTHRYLGFAPDGTYNIRKIRALAWESFNLKLVDIAECPQFVCDAGVYLGRITSLEDLKRSCETAEQVDGLVINALTALDDVSKSAVSFLSRGILGEHIL
ncbi:glycosyltransferase family 2 protein [Gluconobacter cerinus]|uniref:glycosyltransferase family 2 protein n=1 Tax=Gluconobacter cerinus TaxID=38307 RepID=UPI001B8D0A0F|nr:glycosyltransferase family 2 protein [Gluconobacter cerinus]MBS1071087.1 glycosyltransferase family 2 protein [Gluconobacter cerinus]